MSSDVSLDISIDSKLHCSAEEKEAEQIEQESIHSINAADLEVGSASHKETKKEFVKVIQKVIIQKENEAEKTRHISLTANVILTANPNLLFHPTTSTD